MRKVITLKPEASKRLIARSISRLPAVQKAFSEGYIILSLGTTCGYIVEELSGNSIPRSRYACGYISSMGPCLLGPGEQFRLIVFDHGQMIQLNSKEDSLDFSESLIKYLEKMGPGDIFIKGGNVMDSSGKVAVLIGGPEGGEIGTALPYIARGVGSIVPMLVSKTMPGKVDDILEALKEEKVTKEWCDAEPYDVIILPGKVITEIEAIRYLFGIEALPLAFGGIGSNRGATTFLLCGPDAKVEAAYAYLQAIKDESPLQEVKNLDCYNCPSYTFLRKKQGRFLT
ncbi:hypothetical protein [Moorella sulfitireducens (nom. illeg.)]|uniref:hypothetical protein n=1 Tax=Neomoorella sulfitireducens TaxID=2972948 RepID=UPI0021ABA5C7|nr:hypothetical protein [Moorella sulfitireducens]